MKLSKYLIGVVAVLSSGSAWAIETGIKAGVTVNDIAGSPVGTIESVSGDLAVLSTGNNKVSLPLSSFGKGDNGPIIAMTRAQLDAAANGAKATTDAQLKAQLIPGATIYGLGEQMIGTIDTVDGTSATLIVGTRKARLPLTAFSKGAKGPMIGMTAAALNAALDASTAQAASPTPQN